VASITELCRELRRDQTPAEQVLWEYLRNRNTKKHKFLRQNPIYIFVAIWQATVLHS